MKKISIIAGLLFAGIVSAQQKGSIGVNAEPNGATLQVNISSASDLDKTKGQGLAVPNVTKATLSAMTGTIATSAMVYVIGDSSNTDTDFSNTTTNINRTNKVTGLGYYYFNGTEWVQLGEAKAEGIFVRNIRVTDASSISVNETDYYIHSTLANGNVVVTLPSTPQLGRTVCVFLESPNATGEFSPLPTGGYNYIGGTASNCVIWNGSKWIAAVGG